VTAVLPYILLGVIFTNNLTLDGAVDGVVYLLKPDFSQLLNYQVIPAIKSIKHDM